MPISAPRELDGWTYSQNRQSSLYEIPQVPPLTPPLWQSEKTEAATQAIDQLLEEIAPFGLPDDLYPLANSLLPTEPIGQPAYR